MLPPRPPRCTATAIVISPRSPAPRPPLPRRNANGGSGRSWYSRPLPPPAHPPPLRRGNASTWPKWRPPRARQPPHRRPRRNLRPNPKPRRPRPPVRRRRPALPPQRPRGGIVITPGRRPAPAQALRPRRKRRTIGGECHRFSRITQRRPRSRPVRRLPLPRRSASIVPSPGRQASLPQARASLPRSSLRNPKPLQCPSNRPIRRRPRSPRPKQFRRPRRKRARWPSQPPPRSGSTSPAG